MAKVTPNWLSEGFTSALSGVNSSVAPDLVGQSALAWGYNVANRGSRPRTRPYFIRRMTLPTGRVQGASYFSVQNGMGVVVIDGRMYRLRPGTARDSSDSSYEEITLPSLGSSSTLRVWMCQTVESLVVQDFLNAPIIYDGSSARQAGTLEVPRGKQMAYGNGRLWVAVNNTTLAAGDIRTSSPGSELIFTETNYLSGGGTFTFPEGITALGFIATTGTSDYGSLLVFGPNAVDTLRADITARDDWQSMPGFITSALRHGGAPGQTCLAEVNQDMYWRDTEGGIRSLRSSLADESGAGNSPISREVSRLTDFDTKDRLIDCPAINFNNRLLVGSSPYINFYGRTSWGSLVSLDFAPVSTMQGKASPSYDGEWSGLGITHMFSGRIGGKPRCFAVACSPTGENSLWEILDDNSGEIADRVLDCSTDELTDSRVTCYVETARRSFGALGTRKRLERVDVYVSNLLGRADVSVYWRADVNQKWRLADTFTFCAQYNDPEETSDETPHVFKNLVAQHRSQAKTFTLNPSRDLISKYGTHIGFEFQFRIVWTGHMELTRVVAHASPLDESVYAHRVTDDSCVPEDVT